jgi:hypothetical protein
MLGPAGAGAARMRSIVDWPMPVSWLMRYLLTPAEMAGRTRLSPFGELLEYLAGALGLDRAQVIAERGIEAGG